MADPVPARIDGDGRLVSAGDRVRLLNERAGGRLGGAVALPQLAAIARLSQTLGVAISRSVIAADGDIDLELSVRARPDDGAVELAVGGWVPRLPRVPWLVRQPETNDDAPRAVGGWRFATDAALRLTRIDYDGERNGQRGIDLLGQPLTRFVRLIEDAEGDLPILAALANGQDFVGQRAVRRDQPEAELVLSARSRFDDAGRFAGFEGSATGLEGSVEDQPVPGVRMDVRFAGRLDRALRGPLGRIVANADSISTMSDGPIRRDYADYASDIANAGRHLLALVDDLSDLETIERNDFVMRSEPIDLADIARRAAGLLALRAAECGVRIDRPAADEILMACGDFRRVLQILVNLLANALRHSPEGSMIWIRAERDAQSAVLVVADQGRGIAPENHDRIFDKFERIEPTDPGGSGLGLYIARRLARAMGGDITVDSALGQGARFVLTLPAS